MWDNTERRSVLKTKLETVTLHDYVDKSKEILQEFGVSDADNMDKEH